MTKNTSWQQLNRSTIFDSKFLKVYKDKVRLPDGSERDYFLDKKPDIAVIVATTPTGELIMIDEYKYAAGKYMTVLPAGHIEIDENLTETAKRELLEETGYEGKECKYLGQLFEAPVQDLHKVEVIRITGAIKMAETSHENSEDIKTILITTEQLKKEILNNKIQSCSTLGALSLAGLI